MAALVTGKRASARILVADDDPVILRLLEVNLGLEGFDVATAASGPEAVASAREARPALILLDVMMPGTSGWDVVDELRSDPATADIPILLLSARTQDEDRRRAEALGLAGYVTKPFDPAELAATIRRLARSPS